MGLLDELKQDADRARQERANRETEAAALETIYREELCPRLRTIHIYLLELIEQLAAVDWKVIASFDFPGLGLATDLKQAQYRLHIDSTESPTVINLSMWCRSTQEKRYELSPDDADALQKFLFSQEVRSVSWPNRSGSNTTIICEATLATRAVLRFEANVENSSIDLRIANFQNPDLQEISIRNDSVIDEGWLDTLGAFILRKVDTLVAKRTMNDQERLALARRLQAVKEKEALAEEETERLARLEEEALSAAREQNRMELLKTSMSRFLTLRSKLKD